jgi:septation ring formation regulator EzrA
MKQHFDRASERADRAEHEKHRVEGDLARVRDRLKELEKDVSRMAAEDKEHHSLYVKSQEEVRRLTRDLRAMEADLRSWKVKLEDAVLDCSRWKHVAEKARRR